jgi:hypothetical protein
MCATSRMGFKKALYILCWAFGILMTNAPTDLVANGMKWYGAMARLPVDVGRADYGVDIMLAFFTGALFGGALHSMIELKADGSFSFRRLSLKTAKAKSRKQPSRRKA